MKYRPCPKCGGKGEFFSLVRRVAWFECGSCHTIYTVETAENGVVLAVRS